MHLSHTAPAIPICPLNEAACSAEAYLSQFLFLSVLLSPPLCCPPPKVKGDILYRIIFSLVRTPVHMCVGSGSIHRLRTWEHVKVSTFLQSFSILGKYDCRLAVTNPISFGVSCDSTKGPHCS